MIPLLTALACLPILGLSSAAQLTDEDLRNSGNNTLFNRWRPRSHFLSPHSWMNDPCGAVYDPTRDVYHLHYQFHPNHVNWGNISWGHAVSGDLFGWTDVRGWENDTSVSLAAGQFPSDPISQFTGTTQPVNLAGQVDGTLLTFATGIHALPTNWKIPYIPGTEVQALYSSADGGETWSEVGTVLPSPPEGWNVTGWRDPSFFPSTDLDALLGLSEPHFYMVMGSGLKGPDVPAEFPGAGRPGYIGPRMPLYAAPSSNLTDWSFLGALWEPAANSSLGEPDVTGSYGFNFEVSGFFNLPIPNSDEKAWFATMGAEGGNTTMHLRESWALWNRGTVAARANGSVEFVPIAGGALDWGLAYALTTFVDDKNDGRRVMWGWANEDVDGEWFFDTSKAMGYQGSMTFPTELSVLQTKGLDKVDIQDGNVWIEEDDGTFTAQTFGITPLADVLEHLREGSDAVGVEVGRLESETKHVLDDVTDSYELTATLTSFSGMAGIILAQSPDDEEYTTVFFDSWTATIGVDRGHSSSLSAFAKSTHQGYFSPYTFCNGTTEEVRFHIIYDRSLLQIFVNNRFSLTTRIYPSRDDSSGISFFAGRQEFGSGDDGDEKGCGSWKRDRSGSRGSVAVWSDVKVYKGLARAWMDRPDDTSVPLLWDSAEETNNYTWWAGY